MIHTEDAILIEYMQVLCANRTDIVLPNYFFRMGWYESDLIRILPNGYVYEYE